MRLSESYETLIRAGKKFLTEAVQREAEYIAELRQSVISRAKSENFYSALDQDQLESIMFEAYSRGIPIETAKQRVWEAVYIDI